LPWHLPLGGAVFERAYRQRLEVDLARWQADGVIAPTAAEAIRSTFRPLPAGIDVATVVAILGGLLVAAAFLAFVAANWTEIARPLRFLILLAGIGGSYTAGAILDRRGRPYLADISATVGSIVFGAAIALTGQMYHLGEDFAGGMALWAIGAMAAAILAGSRGALAVALLAGVIWNGARAEQLQEVQLSFLALGFVGAGLAVAWNSPVARHLASLAWLGWWAGTALGVRFGAFSEFTFLLACGGSLSLGVGLLLATRPEDAVARFGLTLSTYGAFAFAVALAASFTDPELHPTARIIQIDWLTLCAVAAVVFALAAALISRRIGTGLAVPALVLGLLAVFTWPGLDNGAGGEPWFNYGAALLAMLCLVVSGMLDDVRPRVVAGWFGLAGVIASITWAVKGSLLRRAVFLAVAGAIAIGVAHLLTRLRHKVEA
jgi:uncharacterized membrane protein